MYNVGVNMSNSEMRFCVELKLYLSLTCAQGLPRVCGCAEPTDMRGFHLLSCRLTDANKDRHNLVNNYLVNILRKMGLLVVEEPTQRYPNNELARADGELPNIRSDGRPVEWDLSVVTPLSVAGHQLVHAAEQVGYAAESAATAKREKYIGNGLLTREDRPVLYPLVFETGGRRGKTSTAFFKMIAEAGEDLQWGPQWRFWLTEVPKINAIMMKGTYRKLLKVRHKINAQYDNRLRRSGR